MFEKKLFGRFFLPALLSSLALAFGAAIDSLYIGNNIGESGLFIVGSAAPIDMIFSTLSIGLASGGAVHFTAALGEGKEQKARNIFFSTLLFDFIGILLIVLLGILLRGPIITLLGVASDNPLSGTMRQYVTLMLVCAPVLFMQAPMQYFVYADGNPKLASLALIVGNICDCVFGFLFIVVLKVGIFGSVLATLCGAVVMISICLTHFIKGKGALSFKSLFGSCGKPSIKIAGKSFFTGFSTAAVYFYQFITVLVVNRILLNLAGEWGVAVYDVSYNIGSVVAAVADGAVMAVIALVSTFYSERNKEGIKQSMKIACITGFLLTGVVCGLLAIFAPQCCSLFGISQEVIQDAAYALRLYMACMLVGSLNSIASAYFQSVNKEKFSYIVTALRSFIMLLIFALVFSLGGYKVFWFCFVAAEAVALIVCIVAYKGKLFKDDAAVLSETFIGTTEGISSLCERVQEFLSQNGADQKRSYFISLTADEVFRLIAANGEGIAMQFTLIYNDNDCVLHFRDNARQFDLTKISEDDEIGLRIIKNKSKNFYYRSQVGFNTLTVAI